VRTVLLTACTLCLIGCGYFRRDEAAWRESQLRIVPLSNTEALALSADDVINIMRRSGFTDRQIYHFGVDLRNALMTSGGAQARLGENDVEALFRVQNDLVWIGTLSRGSFIYDVKNHEFLLGGRSQSAGRPQR